MNVQPSHKLFPYLSTLIPTRIPLTLTPFHSYPSSHITFSIHIPPHTSHPSTHILPQVDKAKMKQGSRVSLDMTTLTIMRQLPREVDPLVYSMSIEDPGNVGYSSVGGLSEQIRELREVRA